MVDAVMAKKISRQFHGCDQQLNWARVFMSLDREQFSAPLQPGSVDKKKRKVADDRLWIPFGQHEVNILEMV